MKCEENMDIYIYCKHHFKILFDPVFEFDISYSNKFFCGSFHLHVLSFVICSSSLKMWCLLRRDQKFWLSAIQDRWEKGYTPSYCWRMYKHYMAYYFLWPGISCIYIFIYKEIVPYIESDRILIKRHRRKIHSLDF